MFERAEGQVKSKRPIRAVALLGLPVLALVCLVAMIDRITRICEFTGSTRVDLTLFGRSLTTSYAKSPLEEFVATKHPEILKHNWDYLGTEYNCFLFGGTGRACNTQSGGVLPSAITYLCRELSDERKVKLYEVLVYASTNLERSEKNKLYDRLLGDSGEDLGKMIEEYVIPQTGSSRE